VLRCGFANWCGGKITWGGGLNGSRKTQGFKNSNFNQGEGALDKEKRLSGGKTQRGVNTKKQKIWGRIDSY